MRNGREVTARQTGGENSRGKLRRCSCFPRIYVYVYTCVCSVCVRQRPENCFRVCAVAWQINDFALKAAATAYLGWTGDTLSRRNFVVEIRHARD